MQGPVEYLLVKFSGTSVDASVGAAVSRLVDSGVVHVIELVEILKDADGNVSVLESDAPQFHLAEVDGEAGGLLSQDDLAQAATALAPGEIGVIILWEQVFRSVLAQAVADAGGEIVADEYVPDGDVEAALAALGD